MDNDREWAREMLSLSWGSEKMIVHKDIFYPAELPGFVAWLKGSRAGLITYKIDRETAEIITLNTCEPNMGIGTALIDAVKTCAAGFCCKTLKLTTTNDNTGALRFYQKLGFRLKALRTGAVSESRMLKPEIPLLGENEIPIRDELDLELAL